MSTELQTERRGQTLLITLNGPATRNALSPQVYAAAIETLNMAESSPDVSAVVLTGAGGHFCSGDELAELAHKRQHDLPGHAEQIDAFHEWIEALRAFPKPVIAAVEGAATGAGVSLALACDLIVATTHTQFVMGYGNMGLSPDGGATWHLTRALGRGAALALLWGDTPQTATDWLNKGLVHRVVNSGTALNEALAWADALAALPVGVLASVKELVNEGPQQSLREQLASEKRHFLVNLVRNEAGVAINALLHVNKG
jgi:enoyl-CoA hydratase/carnithine racemase